MPSDAKFLDSAELISVLRTYGDGPFPSITLTELAIAYANAAGDKQIPSIASLSALLKAEGTDGYITPEDIRKEWRDCNRITCSTPYRVLQEIGNLNRPTDADVNAAIERLIEQTNAEFFPGCDAESVLANSQLNDQIHQLGLVTLKQVEDTWEFCLRNGIAPFPSNDSPYSIN